MTTLKQFVGKNTSMFLLLMGVLMLAVSLSSTASAGIIVTPACDGVTCATKADCGTKCICNQFEFVCLDNT
jgi:hypothetical protein